MTDILRFFILRFVDNYYLSIFKGIGAKQEKNRIMLISLNKRASCCLSGSDDERDSFHGPFGSVFVSFVSN